MLTWDTKYLIGKFKSVDFNDLIDLSKSTKENSQLNKIDIMEKKYQEQISYVMKLIENKELLNNLLKQKSFDLLNEETKLVKLLSKYSLQQNNYQIPFIINLLKVIYQVSDTLSKRIKQNKITHKSRQDKPIVRCSYKFCIYKSNCNFYYKKKRKCNSDHFVHNMICADIEVLINYFTKINQNNFKSNKEIIKSINTILFVVSHMEAELGDSCRYQKKEDWEKFHI